MCCWLEQKKPKSTRHLHFSTTTPVAQVTAMGKPDGGSGDWENDTAVVLGYAWWLEVDSQSHSARRREKKVSL